MDLIFVVRRAGSATRKSRRLRGRARSFWPPSSSTIDRAPRIWQSSAMAGRFIDVVSDSTGETAEKVVRAALLQFPQAGAVIRLHTRVRTKEIARAILERSSKEGALFVFTVVSPELREFIHSS